MKKFLILGLVLVFWAAPALAQNNQGDPGAGRPGIHQGGQQEAQQGAPAHRGPRRHNHGSTAPIPEEGDEIANTEAAPYSNTDFAPWDNHLNVDAPVMSVE